MECLIECFFEVLGGILEHLNLPKWLDITRSTVFVVGLLALLIFAVCRASIIVLQVLLVLALLALLILFSVLLCKHFLFGSLVKARKKDLPQVLALYRSVISKPGCNWSISYPNDTTLHDDFRTGNLYILKKGRKLIGAASIVPENELDDLQLWYYRKNVKEIARIVIAPEQQGKGHGKYMIRKLCLRLRRKGCRTIHLLVSTENNRAKNLYRENGFLSRGPVHRYDHNYYAYERKLK